MRLGFTGTRHIRSGDLPALSTLADRVLDMGPDEVTTGGCIGFDAWIGVELHFARPRIHHRVIVPADRSRADYWWAVSGRVEVIEMPGGTSYRDRNDRILDFADQLIACADAPEHDAVSARSGTWMTVRLARARGIPVHVTLLDRAVAV